MKPATLTSYCTKTMSDRFVVKCSSTNSEDGKFLSVMVMGIDLVTNGFFMQFFSEVDKAEKLLNSLREFK